MKCNILHETPGRMRVHLALRRMSLREADLLEYDLKGVAGVVSVKVFDRTQDAVITYTCPRADIVRALSSFSFTSERALARLPEHTARALNREYEDKLVFTVCRRAFSRLFLPVPVQTAIALFRSVKYIRAGLSALLHGKLSVAVLDATAVTVSMVRGDFATAGSVMFMLRLGEILEEWTHKKSVANLAGAMALNVDKVWLQSGETELLVPIGDVKPGDRMIVRTGNLIPLDGKVVSGEATVNQASITGESMPAPKREGSYVYAGTVVEEGECIVNVEKALGGGRYDRIVHMIEESEKLKSTAEDKAARLADRLVPYTLGGTALTYLVTRNVTKMLAVLMVDFSCALKLAMPIAVLSAMRESSSYHISVKGGRFLEAVARADTVVFDKTGTLTYAEPKVAQIVPFGGHEETEMLRLAACLEEHYPHSMANAVVEEAKKQGLKHEEYHSQVQYVVAHGISSMVEGKKVLIGSAHFVFEDEGCTIPEDEREKFDSLPAQYSHLYLCIAGELAAVICIFDPLRAEAADVEYHNPLIQIHGALMAEDVKRTFGEQFQRKGDFLCLILRLFQNLIPQIAQSRNRAFLLRLLIYQRGAAVNDGFLLRPHTVFINLLHQRHDKLRLLHNGVVFAISVYHIHGVQPVFSARRHTDNGGNITAQRLYKRGKFALRIADQNIIVGVQD